MATTPTPLKLTEAELVGNPEDLFRFIEQIGEGYASWARQPPRFRTRALIVRARAASRRAGQPPVPQVVWHRAQSRAPTHSDDRGGEDCAD